MGLKETLTTLGDFGKASILSVRLKEKAVDTTEFLRQTEEMGLKLTDGQRNLIDRTDPVCQALLALYSGEEDDTSFLKEIAFSNPSASLPIVLRRLEIHKDLCLKTSEELLDFFGDL